MQSFVALRVKKALGIFRELITTTTTTTRVAFGDPPSGHGHGLHTLTTVPRSTQPSTLRGMVK